MTQTVSEKRAKDPYYSSDAYHEKCAAAQQQELARQDLTAKRPTRRALQYARFLSAVENDATHSGGGFGTFAPSPDEEIFRQYPFLREVK